MNASANPEALPTETDRLERGCSLARGVVLALTGLGFAARVWHLGSQSLWLDEALSVTFAGQPLAQMLPTLVARDLHPPLYYLLLHLWMHLAGQGEFAVRFVSLALGLPAIPATYQFALALFGRPARVAPRAAVARSPGRAQLIGVLAATLVALSPFLVYYAQEARMYSGLATFGLLSSLALWKLLETGARRWGVGFVAFTTALLYTQYFGGLVVAFQLLYLVGLLVWPLLDRWPIQRRPEATGVESQRLSAARDGTQLSSPERAIEAGLVRRSARSGLLGLLAVGVLYLPWVPSAYLQMLRLYHVPDFWKGDLSLSFLLGHVFAAFTFGQFTVLGRLTVVAIAVATAVLVGLALLLRQAVRRGAAEAYTLAYLLIPLAVLYAVLVQNPKFTERYLIMIAPPFYLALSLAIVELAAWARKRRGWPARFGGYVLAGGIAGALLLTSLNQLEQIYDGPGYRKEDNRGLEAYVQQHYRPGDVVILMMDPYSFPYYSHGQIPAVTLQPGNDVAGAAQSLNAILAGHQRAWVVLWNADWADPTGYTRQALESAYPRVSVPQFQGLTLELFVLDHPPHFSVRTTPEHAEPVDFGGRLQLLGYDLSTATVEAGRQGAITLYWQAKRPLDRDYIASLRLTDGHFYYWRLDRRPAAETYPTSSWPVGQVVSGTIPFQVPLGTPPGQYYLELGTYAQEVKQDLDVLINGQVPSGTAARVAEITVTRPPVPPDPNRLGLSARLDYSLGNGLRLLAASVETPSAPPGGTVDLTLWWQAERPGLAAQQIALLIRSGQYERMVVDEAPDAGRYPTDRWQEGEVIADKHRFVVPPDAPPGRTQVVAVVHTPAAPPGPGGGLTIGAFAIQSRVVQLTPPAEVGTPVSWTFGSFAHLIGFKLEPRLARPGDHLQLTLYWQALGSSGSVGYTVFTHLLDQRSLIWAHQDHPPGNGDNPTSGWIPGEYLVDRYDLAIKPDASPGTYQIEVGLYNPATGARVAVRDAQGRESGDRVILAAVQIR